MDKETILNSTADVLGTPAAKKFEDDVPLADKKRRLNEIISLQKEHGLLRNEQRVGKTYKVLIEGNSRRSEEQWMGRNSANIVVVFDKPSNSKVGDYYQVKITRCTGATLIGEVVA